VTQLLVHASHEMREDARVAHQEKGKDARAASYEQSSSVAFLADRLLNDAGAAHSAHSRMLAEAQEGLFKAFSYFCMGIFFTWWATATTHRLSSECQGGWFNTGCNLSKISVVIVEVMWIGLVVLGKNIRAVMVLFILTNGALLWNDFIHVNLSVLWGVLLGGLVCILYLISNPAVCELEEQLFCATHSKVQQYKERVLHAKEAARLEQMSDELIAAMSTAEESRYTHIKHVCLALLLGFSLLLGSEPYWFPASAGENWLCVSH